MGVEDGAILSSEFSTKIANILKTMPDNVDVLLVDYVGAKDPEQAIMDGKFYTTAQRIVVGRVKFTDYFGFQVWMIKHKSVRKVLDALKLSPVKNIDQSMLSHAGEGDFFEIAAGEEM